MLQRRGKKTKGSYPIHFITAGERGIVQIWSSDGLDKIDKCFSRDTVEEILHAQEEEAMKPLDDWGKATLQKMKEASPISLKVTLQSIREGRFQPLDQCLIPKCTTDAKSRSNGSANTKSTKPSPSLLNGSNLKPANYVLRGLSGSKTLIGYNEEISDMKFLGDDEQFIAVSTSFEQVRVYDIASMSSAYVLAGHTDVVLCLDTCVTGSGKTLVVTGSKDKSIRVWDAERQSCLGVGKGHMGSVGAIVFSRKQRNFVVSASRFGA